MSTEIVPTSTKLAAKRGFLRTMMQGYEATLAVGLSANVILGLIRGEVDLVAAGVTAGVTIAAPPLAGLRSWLSIMRNGIPADYREAALDEAAESDGFTTPEG